MFDLFDTFDPTPQPDVVLESTWLDNETATAALTALIDEVAWRQDEMNTPAGRIPFPRLTAWQGEPDAIYVYSGIRNVPQPWTPTVSSLKARAEAVSNVRFNSVLINRYRSGTDSMGWHADKERELGREPVIASISLGTTRTFEFRHNATRQTHKMPLPHGSLLVMRGRTQLDWVHRIPKEPNTEGERINLTFRQINPADAQLSRSRPAHRAPGPSRQCTF